MGERLGAAALIMEQAENLLNLELVWADAGYSGQKFALGIRSRCVSSIANLISTQVEIIKRTK